MYSITNDYSIIGGSDGPTAIFLAGKFDNGWNWINIFGIIIVVLMLVPNIIYAIRFRNIKNQCTNKLMNILEQIGRYASMFFMVVHVMGGYGFSSVGVFLIYLLGNGILMLAYWVIWMLFFIRRTKWKSMALAMIPTMIFLISGITLEYIPLIISAFIFGVGHIYVTTQNKLENIETK